MDISTIFLGRRFGCDELVSSIRGEMRKTDQYGLRIDLQALQVTGSYSTGGKSSLSLNGTYNADIGTTVRVASMRDDGQTFQLSLIPFGCLE